MTNSLTYIFWGWLHPWLDVPWLTSSLALLWVLVLVQARPFRSQILKTSLPGTFLTNSQVHWEKTKIHYLLYSQWVVWIAYTFVFANQAHLLHPPTWSAHMLHHCLFPCFRGANQKFSRLPAMACTGTPRSFAQNPSMFAFFPRKFGLAGPQNVAGVFAQSQQNFQKCFS